MKKLFAAITIAFLLTGCGRQSTSAEEPMLVIFETDIGNDIDDVLALDMLYKYMDAGKVKVLAIMNNKADGYSAEFVDIMNTWYGYPDIPIGDVGQGVIIDGYVDYAESVVKLEAEGKPMFARTRCGYNDCPSAPELYRKVLSEQKDNSVTVISVGFSTNLARLLNTPADEYSPLTGKELAARKVKTLSVMAGSFGDNRRAEFNVKHDIPAAQKLFDEWQGEIILSPFELGKMIMFPGSVIENDFDRNVENPLVEAYYHYHEMPYDRPTWDLTSVLYAVDAKNSGMDVSESGILSVDDEGYMTFAPDDKGKHHILSTDKQRAELIGQYFVDLIKTRPARASH